MPLPLPRLCHLLMLPCRCFSNLATAAAILCYCSIMAGWCNFLPLTCHCSAIFSLLLLLPNISQGEFSFASVTLTIFHFWKKIVSLLMICRGCCLRWQCAEKHSSPCSGIDKPSSAQRVMLMPHLHCCFCCRRPTLPHLSLNSCISLCSPSSQPTSSPSSLQR